MIDCIESTVQVKSGMTLDMNRVTHGQLAAGELYRRDVHMTEVMRYVPISVSGIAHLRSLRSDATTRVERCKPAGGKP